MSEVTSRESGGRDIRPTVASGGRGMPVWLFVIAAAIAGILLFVALESRRQSLTAPAVRARVADAVVSPAPPPLFIPPDPAVPRFQPSQRLPEQPFVRLPPSAPPSVIRVPQTAAPIYIPPPPPAPLAIPETQPASRAAPGGSALVIDTTSNDSPTAATAAPSGAEAGAQGANPPSPTTPGRVRAGQFVNRSTTVPQGALISAVTETAIDSTRPGQVRALISRDVRGFDGTRVLIPRGSRIYGEYRADLQRGQNRALVQWTRLIRPDGVTIALGSPAADPLGRAGIRGRVDSHFFERFGAAILQSTLDIGVGVATHRLGGTSVVILPTGTQAAGGSLVNRDVQPTLTVRQGARVTVFVARDLDFTGADGRVR